MVGGLGVRYEGHTIALLLPEAKWKRIFIHVASEVRLMIKEISKLITKINYL